MPNMLRFALGSLLVGVAALSLGACASKGSWMGAEAEKAYDKDLEIQRLASVLNNDDYYEFEKDGRIYVLSDAKDYTNVMTIGELPYSTKKIGGGPGGKTIIYGLVKNETKLLEKDPKSQGAAQKMYEGKLKGMDKNFFGLVVRADTYFVFGKWKDLEAFWSQGSASGYTTNAVDGRQVIYVASADKPAELAARFEKLPPAKL